ncbi:MAG: rhomboid family intramembrane serine protease [Rhizobiaceae bacterium]|nr:rhomboid family intramembrane serine protease [Rhizobiaceae bacterium]
MSGGDDSDRPADPGERPSAGAEPGDSAVVPAAEARREPIFNLPAVVIGAIGLCAGIHLVRLYLLTADADFTLLLYAAFIPIRYSGHFALDLAAFTSPFTYSVLHGSLAHLAVNMVWLAAFGTPLANRLGALRFVLFWLATAFAAAALHYALHVYDQAPLVGASGAISGMMGAAARFGFRIDRSGRRAAFSGPPLSIAECLRRRSVVTFLGIWMAVNLVTGLVGFGPGSEMSIAWEAHVGGFLAGFLGIGSFLAPSPRASAA